MSLINQVLSDLEKRGVKSEPVGMPVRPVSVRDPRRKIIYLVLIALLLAGASVLWAVWHKPAQEPEALTTSPVMPHQNTGQPASILGSATRDESMHDTLALQPGKEKQPDVKHDGMRMSLELNTVPQPPLLPRERQTLQASAVEQMNRMAPPKMHIIGTAGMQMPNATAGAGTAESSSNVEKIVTPSGSMTAGINKTIRQETAQQQAENEFRKANALMQQGRIDEAIGRYQAALQLNAGHDAARQALVGLLLESKHNIEAENVLKEGLGNNPGNSGFAMLLARLQVERNALQPALETLQKTLPYADQQADYQAFIAAILQRLGRNKDAIEHYQVALKITPGSGVWLMGLGISLQAEKRDDAARTAFRQAVDSHTLNGELQAFVKQRLRELNP